MSKIVLLLVGSLPLLVGYAMDQWIFANPEEILPFRIIGIIFLVFWSIIGLLSFRKGRHQRNNVIIAHIPAFVLLISFIGQQYLPSYFRNILSRIAQLYFLPLTNISGRITNLYSWIIYPDPTRMWEVYLISFILMIVVFLIGSNMMKAFKK